MSVVLVAENATLIRFLVIESLRDDGRETLEANSAFDALTLLKERDDVDVLFSDFNLAGDADGLQLAWTVSRVFPHIKILITAAGQLLMSDDMPRGSRFLPKPYLLSEMKYFVERIIAVGKN